MGILLNGLGNLSGKVGDVVFRQRNGKTYIAKAPKRRSNYVSEETIQRRNKFAAAGHIARAINSMPHFKEIWNFGGNKKSSPYNKIFKRIYTCLKENDYTIGGILPNHGDIFIKCRFEYLRNKIITELIEPEFEGIVYTEKELFLMVTGIVVLTEPVNVMDQPMRVIAIKSNINELNMKFPNKIEFEFCGCDLAEVCGYNNKEFYLHLMTLDANGKVQRYSCQIDQFYK